MVSPPTIGAFSYEIQCREGSWRIHPSSHTKNVDVQRNGGDVAHIHIGNAEIHQHVYETVTFALPWKRKREKEHDTIEDLDMSQREFTMEGVVHT